MDSDAAHWARIVAAASGVYRHADGYALRFARSKLRHDRVFRHVLEHGLIAPGAHVIDVGCGQGLLASLLCAAQQAARRGEWPVSWAAAPAGATVLGIDRRTRDLERAAFIDEPAARFARADMRSAAFPSCDVAVFLDSLHYIEPAQQDAVLARVRAVLRPGGVLLLRVHDSSARLRLRFGLAVDRLTMGLRGGGFAPLHGRPLAQWEAALRALGLDVQSLPMNGRFPFANRLLVARRSD